jgi:hypothetical protein
MVFLRQPEVVSISHDDHPALASVLERALIEERTTRVSALINAKDWPDYEKRRGEINGLTAAISICIEVRKRIEA